MATWAPQLIQHQELRYRIDATRKQAKLDKKNAAAAETAAKEKELLRQKTALVAQKKKSFFGPN
jgi:hypothetical protein